MTSTRRIALLLAAIGLLTASIAYASRAPARRDPAAASRAKPHLTVQPRVLPAGGRLTFIGSGFRRNATVWLGIGPPQSEARHVGSARANKKGAFRKTRTVNPRLEPGRWIALACQNRSCRIKAGAAFHITEGRG